MKKVSKKIKTAPASLEKPALGWLKPSKLVPPEYGGTQTGQLFNATLTCFSAHLTRSSPELERRCMELIDEK